MSETRRRILEVMERYPFAMPMSEIIRRFTRVWFDPGLPPSTVRANALALVVLGLVRVLPTVRPTYKITNAGLLELGIGAEKVTS